MMKDNGRLDRIISRGVSLRREHPVGTLLGALALSTIGLGGTLWACADSSCAPSWQLASAEYDCGGRAVISPGNDTRINMLWLMRSLAPDDRAQVGAVADANNPQFGQSFMTWPGLRAALWPQTAGGGDDAGQTMTEAPGCDASSSGIPAFNAALDAETALPEPERAALRRFRLQAGCGDANWDDKTVSSKPGREYLSYLKAADAFYKADWPAARSGFASLTRARSRWVAETAIYMPIRIGLRAAMAQAVDEYGDFAGPDKVDRTAVAQAEAAIAAYLKAYPKGRYRASAEGLRRRVAWLGGDWAALTQSYEKLLATTPGGDEAAADLAEEIDIKLLERSDASTIVGKQQNLPLLTAIVDLKRMRQHSDGAAPLSASELAAQQAHFRAHGDLYGLLQASRSYYAGEEPKTILALLPDAARQSRFTPLAFSRQTLRGMALSKLRDPNEVGFWRDLLGGASPLYQRPLVEMGLAVRWQRDGRLDQIFATGSPITDSPTRSILLQTVATPAILRASAGDAARPARERDLARFTLLYKDLTRGAFGDFAADLALVPVNAPADSGLWDFTQQDVIPVGLFRKGKWSDGFACPTLMQTAATLARNPANVQARLCLGDFYRLNGFDGFSLFKASDDKLALGNGPDGFPGRPQSRDDIYARIIADRNAAAEDRAYALYRAVMCYAPSGYNSCGGPYRNYEEMEAAQAPQAERKAWFTELKQRYPDSRWAKALRYYW
ncbi:hypothetical protein Sphch_3918 [Sphingobium chlorophenolicum L-1]|uniref:Outer membrane assembly lipoprotein YfiO n=1 Tax=Sphingobium chlorophenolicum L-1 TaxID=690566 RepID=F6F1T2_SPHCR|nr:hypothetical protein [Sphingobium chlorophenolicum]AEG51498.1 hypothetical protein Sphch_3918 [Sphingobium chlorophenolicum L-1]